MDDEEKLKQIEKRLTNLELALLHFAATLGEHHGKLDAVGKAIESINEAVKAELAKTFRVQQPQEWRKAG